MKKRILSLLLAIVMMVGLLPMPGHVHAAEETTESAPVCDCGTDDETYHATNCPVYVAPEDPPVLLRGKMHGSQHLVRCLRL